ncbi:MAG: class I SAM-dependent methyltransferase [Bacteroidota bacterium]
MNLNDLQRNWDQFGKEDPFWAIITRPEMKGNKWEEEAFFATGQGRARKVTKKINRLLPNFRFQSALDFGCGVGRITQALADHFEAANGVDIAPSMIKLAKELNKKSNCHYFLNEKNDLSLFKAEQFDLVFSVITLQHMQPRYAKNYLAEFLRVLKKGGMLIFQIPSKPDQGTLNYHNALGKLQSSTAPSAPSENTQPVMEMYWIPIGEVVNLLTAQGGQILRIEKDNAAGEDWDSYTYYVGKP